MKPPLRLSYNAGQVYKLKRALYGIKQAPRAWFEKFSSTLNLLGFSFSNYDYDMFVKHSSKGCVIMLLFVDDMIITKDDDQGI